MNEAIALRYVGKHRLYLRFADGTEGALDLAPRLRFDGVFAPLRDPAAFGQARVDPELATVVWPGGADLCPDVLREWVGEARRR